MWNEICEGLCARRQGDCRVAVSGAEESAQAYVAGAARAVGAPFAEGKAEFACGGGKVVLTAGGSAGADAVLFALPAGSDADAVRAAAASAGGKPFAALPPAAEPRRDQNEIREFAAQPA